MRSPRASEKTKNRPLTRLYERCSRSSVTARRMNAVGLSRRSLTRVKTCSRLHVFTLVNERRESPTAFIRRAVTDEREHLSYKRVSGRFFVFSDARGDLILYRRCNF